MKLIILTSAYPSHKNPGGCAFIHARTQLYEAAGHQVLVLNTPPQDLPEHDQFEGIEIRRPTNLEMAYEVVTEFGPDVIGMHFPYRGSLSTQLAESLLGHYPIVVWIHGFEAMYTAFHSYHQGFNRLLSIPWDWRKLRYLRGFLARCQAVVYVSNWIRKTAERGMGYCHPNSFVIANPIDTNRFTPAEQPPSNGQLRGVALRNLGRVYGHEIGIRAFVGLDKTHLTIIGTGPLESKLRSLIDKTGSNTTLLSQGFPHAEVPDLLRKYDYFVAPSRNETQGLAMCEAMACGLPVVATNVGGIPEFVRDGVDGYLVPPENPNALREAVLKLIAEPEWFEQMGYNARQHMLELCAGDKIVPQELQVLHTQIG